MHFLEAEPGDCFVNPSVIRQKPSTALPFVQKHLKPLTEIVEWIENFLCCPHPDLGRRGPVCAFTKKSLEKGFCWLTVYEAEQPTCEEICDKVIKYQHWYGEIAPHEDEEDAQYKTLLILFPYLQEGEAQKLLEKVQKVLEADFIAKNLLLGHFYPQSEQPGLWSAKFRPMVAPIPLLAIRHIVQMDFVNSATIHRMMLGHT
jgi:hypothetical protein